MDFAVTWLGIIGPTVIAAGLAIWGFTDGNRITALWVGFSGALLLLVAMTLHLQQGIRKHEAAAVKQVPSDVEVRQLRAYVFAADGGVTHVAGTPPTAFIIVRNTGRTPAFALTWRAKFVVGATEAEFSLDNDPVPSNTTLQPDGVLSYSYTFPSWDPNFDEMLKAETAGIFAIGEIRYKDAYGNDRFTNYRFISGGAFRRSTGVSPGKFGVAPDGGNDSN